MPVQCLIETPRLASDQLATIFYGVMGASFAMDDAIGRTGNRLLRPWRVENLLLRGVMFLVVFLST